MLFWTIVKVGLKSLLGNPLRSFLTMLGIIIVTHESEIAARCRRQIHMRDGRVVETRTKG